MSAQRSRLPWLATAAFVVLGACADPGASSPQALEGRALGTTWTVKWRGATSADEVGPAVLEALEAVDEAMSTWRDDSDLSRARGSAEAVVVSEETAWVTRHALALAEATGGAFDPTVQPLMELWGLHGGTRVTWPTDDEVAEARSQLGVDRVRLGRGPDGEPTLAVGGAALDLSAIAKGYAVDRVSWGLSALGETDHFVEVGGEVRAHGERGDGSPWRVGVEAPGPGASGFVATVPVVNQAVATSGNYRSRRVLEGREVWHTMDPRTGRPAEERVLSATVVAPDCMTADGWATALMVLGETGLPLVESRAGLEAFLILQGGGEAASSGFRGTGGAAGEPFE